MNWVGSDFLELLQFLIVLVSVKSMFLEQTIVIIYYSLKSNDLNKRVTLDWVIIRKLDRILSIKIENDGLNLLLLLFFNFILFSIFLFIFLFLELRVSVNHIVQQKEVEGFQKMMSYNVYNTY